MTQDEYLFCQSIAKFIEADPRRLRMVQDATFLGISTLNEKLMEAKADFETAAHMFANARLFKGNERFLAQKIRKWSDIGFTSTRWDSVLEKLEKE